MTLSQQGSKDCRRGRDGRNGTEREDNGRRTQAVMAAMVVAVAAAVSGSLWQVTQQVPAAKVNMARGKKEEKKRLILPSDAQ